MRGNLTQTKLRSNGGDFPDILAIRALVRWSCIVRAGARYICETRVTAGYFSHQDTTKTDGPSPKTQSAFLLEN